VSLTDTTMKACAYSVCSKMSLQWLQDAWMGVRLRPYC